MEVAKPKYVWWDMDSCPVPCGRDPYEVRGIIESALNKKFGAGPVTIFAIGNTNLIPLGVLEPISRSGILIRHSSYGGRPIMAELLGWTIKNPSPAILMLISDHEFYYSFLEHVQAKGFTILRTYVNPQAEPPKYASDVWLWKTLFTDTEQETTRPSQGKCFETGEPHWYCTLCRLGGQSFTDFTTHLKTKEHLLWPDPCPSDKDLASLRSPSKIREDLASLPFISLLAPFKQGCEKDLASLDLSAQECSTSTVLKQSKKNHL